MVPGVVNFCWKVSPCCIPPDAPELNFGPGPLSLVTSWPTLSSLVHFTVPPFLMVTLVGLKAMFWSWTLAFAWGARPPELAGFLLELVELELLLLLPQPIATRATRRM